MSTLTVSDIALDTTNPAQRLRRTAAAVRVALRREVGHPSRAHHPATEEEDGAAASAGHTVRYEFGKRLIDTRHEAVPATDFGPYPYRQLLARHQSAPTSNPACAGADPPVRYRKVSFTRWRASATSCTGAEELLNQVYDQVKADARRRLGRLYNPADYPEEIHDLFDVSWDFPSVEPPNYLMQVAPEVYAEERPARRCCASRKRCGWPSKPLPRSSNRLLSHLTERLGNGEGLATGRVFAAIPPVTNLTEFFRAFSFSECE